MALYKMCLLLLLSSSFLLNQHNLTKGAPPCAQIVQTLQRENVSFKRCQIYLTGAPEVPWLCDVIAICLYATIWAVREHVYL